MKSQITSKLALSALLFSFVHNIGASWVEWSPSVGGNGHSYNLVLVTNLVDWGYCKVEAEAMGGHLVSIESAAENTFVYSLADSNPQAWSFGGAFGPAIGAVQPAGAAEPAGGWSWVSSEPWSYVNWSGGQPDNGDVGGESIAHFLRGGRWNDKSATSKFLASFIVERSTCTPRKARAVAQVINGFVVGAEITDPGCGYTNAPLVLIEGGGGSGATARATINSGFVSGIVVTSAGSGYTSAPSILIASPPFVPTVEIGVSKVKVVQNVVLGRRYVLEFSQDGFLWNTALPPFTAFDERITNEFDADLTGRLFRIREAQ